MFKDVNYFSTQNETKNKIEAKQYDVIGYGTNQKLDCQDCICTFYQVWNRSICKRNSNTLAL